MEFSIKIDGVYQDLKAKDPEEAAKLIKLLTGSSSDTGPETPLVPEEDEVDVFSDVLGHHGEHGTIEAVLSSLRGTKTAEFVVVLAGMKGLGGLDTIIKENMSGNGRKNLAPFVASISKACKRGGVEISSILIRKEKRVRSGKMVYHYRLANAAAEFVNAIPDYKNDEVFGMTSDCDEHEVESKPEGTRESKTVTGRGSNRSIVRHSATSKTIAEISDETGLSKSQVRGVVNAPGERDNYKSVATGTGENRYTYAG